VFPSFIVAILCVAGAIEQDAKAAARPEIEKRSDGALLDEYNARRAKVANTADGHWKLGLWCEQKGLKDQAHVEFLIVCQLDPNREAAWKKLGYLKQDGKWTTPAKIAAERAEAEAQKKADAHWRPLVQSWKAGLARKEKRAESERALATVTDPRAVPSIWKAFATGKPEDQEMAIDMLGRIEGERPSRALAGLAILGKTDVIRRAATESLVRRDHMDVLMNWIGLLHDPIKYEVKQVAGPGMPGVLFVEGEEFNLRRFYLPPTAPQIGQASSELIPDGFLLPLKTDSPPPWPPKPGAKPVGMIDNTPAFIYDWTWAPKVPPKYNDPSKPYQEFERNLFQSQIDADYQLQEASKVAAGAQAQLANDVSVIEAVNGTIRERNARLAEALRRVSGTDFGEDREAWLKWWLEKRGYKYIAPKDRDKTTLDMQVALPYFPTSGPARITNGNSAESVGGYCIIWDHEKNQAPRAGRCFAAGTPVLTPGGAQAIETLRCGDRVLGGSATDGSRRAETILAVHQSAASRTLRLTVGGESVVTTEGHPFAKLGGGWTRAGDLRAGDPILAASGPARVEAISIEGAQTVWNLRLAEDHRFLVGGAGLVVHDGSPILPAHR
jgi:hypothetical protein